MSITKSTIVVYEYSGSTSELTIPFDYLKRDFVVVSLEARGKPQKGLKIGVDYRFTTKTTIVITRPYQPSEGYNKIAIRRVTDASKRIVNYQDGSILNATELNTSQLQALHVAEEARDLTSYTLFVDNDGNLNARDRVIINLGDPINPQDAATKKYVDTASESVIDSRDKALQYRNEAEQFKNQSEKFRNEAEQLKIQSKGFRDEAEEAKVRAIAAESASANYARNAQNSKDQATTQASKATQMASQAQSSAGEAKKSQTASKTSETNAARDAKRAEDAADKAVGGGIPMINLVQTVGQSAEMVMSQQAILKNTNITVDTVAILKTMDLKDGDMIELLGHDVKGDCGSHLRKVTSSNAKYAIPLNNGLYASLIDLKVINISHVGPLLHELLEDQDVLTIILDKDIRLTRKVEIGSRSSYKKMLFVEGKGFKIESDSIDFLNIGTFTTVTHIDFRTTVNIEALTGASSRTGCIVKDCCFINVESPFKIKGGRVGIWGVLLKDITIQGGSDVLVDIDAGSQWVTSTKIDGLITQSCAKLLRTKGKVEEIQCSNNKIQLTGKADAVVDLGLGTTGIIIDETNYFWDPQYMKPDKSLLRIVTDKRLRGRIALAKGLRMDLKNSRGEKIQIKDAIETFVLTDLYGTDKWGVNESITGPFGSERWYKLGEFNFSIFDVDSCNFMFIVTGATGNVYSMSQAGAYMPNIVTIRYNQRSNDSWIYYSDPYAKSHEKHFYVKMEGKILVLYYKCRFQGHATMFKDLFYAPSGELPISDRNTTGHLYGVLKEVPPVSGYIVPSEIKRPTPSLPPSKALDTPYFTTKMKEEGVYDDFKALKEGIIEHKRNEKLKEEAMKKAYEDYLDNNKDGMYMSYYDFLTSRTRSFKYALNINIEDSLMTEPLQKFIDTYMVDE